MPLRDDPTPPPPPARFHPMAPRTRPTPRLALSLLLAALLGVWLISPSAVVAQADDRKPGDEPPPAPEGVDPALWDTLVEIDAAMAKVEDMTARFDKLKHTPLLRKPLTSTGRVRIKGDAARWDTDKPHAGTTLMRDGEVRVYQPDEKRLEVYPLDKRFDLFGASPMPRMTAMAERFEIERVEPGEVFDELAGDGAGDGDAEDDRWLALRLTPKDEQIAEHVRAMTFLLDGKARRMARLRIDPPSEGSWTEYRFKDVKLNRGVDDAVFELNLPDDVEVVRPLEGATP